MGDTRGWHVWITGGGNVSKMDYCFNASKTARRWASNHVRGDWIVRACDPAAQGGECVLPPSRRYMRHSPACPHCKGTGYIKQALEVA